MMPTRRAGISVPLFALRSSRSWGIGEIGDIPEASRWLYAAHQSVLQILPLNELAPDESSPYSSLSAMAIDPQFISIWMLDGGDDLERQYQRDIEAVRASARIDYLSVRRLKTKALRVLFNRFYESEWLRDTEHAAALRAYGVREAWWITEYSLFRAIRAQQGERPWTEWPEGLRDRQPAALDIARAELAREVLFYQYVQWIGDEQLRQVRHATPDLEILGDFPFMVTRDSADVWSRRHDFVLDAQVGTPPDAFSETGQEWGLPPYNWDVARQSDFAWLRMRARRMAALFDGFRIDHLVGFYRTYVRPYDDRLPRFDPVEEQEQLALGEAIVGIMLDSGADVSAEDLGTVPPFVRRSLSSLGVPGYKVLRWEPDAPQMFPPVSIAMTGTHDTETVAVWWESLLPDERARYGMTSAAYTSEVRDVLLEVMFNAGSNLILLPVQDVFGWRERINLPATISNSNWTYVLPWPVDRMLMEPEAVACARRLAEWSDRSGRWGHYKTVPAHTSL